MQKRTRNDKVLIWMRARSAPVPAVCSSFCVDPIGENQHPRAHAWSVASLCNLADGCAARRAVSPRLCALTGIDPRAC